MTATALTIGRLAESAGVGVETIRYYERRGLLPPPPRTASGYRQYSEEEVRRLALIRRAKDLGFTLTEILELLDGDDGGAAGVRRAAVAKLAAVEGEMAALAAVRARLAGLVATCDGGDDEGCASLTPGCVGAAGA